MFKDRLKEYRQREKLTQKELGNKLGLSHTTISEMESGKNKGSIKVLKKLADISGLSLTYWTGEEEGFIKNPYEALDTFIETLIEIGQIEQDGKIPLKYKDIILELLENEIALKIERSKKLK